MCSPDGKSVTRMTLERRNKRVGLLFFLPAGLVIFGIIVYPLLVSLVTSFTAYSFIDPSYRVFVGFDNYLAIFYDIYFWNSIYVVSKFVVVVVSLEFVLGFTIALLLNRDIKAKGVFYTILSVPMVMAPVAVALIWRVFLHPELGIVNYLLAQLRIRPVNWLGSSSVAFWTVVMVDIWHQVSFMILVLLAGLVSLPRDVYEAASIDGASMAQRFTHITLPLMKPVILVALLLRTIFGFRTFDLVYVLTRGGPGVATDMTSYYIYRHTFMGLNIAESTAASYLFLLFNLVVVVFLYRALRLKEEVS
ncbi:MAG: carbohydrate ABC transporter permease [Spirochaetota bacterium]